MKKKIIALFLFLFILLQLPFGASALVFKDPLTTQTRGIHTISNYEQINLGRAGELRVNEYNQELLLTREELSLAGENLPVQLRRTYHSYPTGQNSIVSYGAQWSINYSVRLRYDTEGGFFIYDRDDGSRTVFQKTKWVSGDWVCWRETSEIGLLYQLWMPKGSTDVAQAKMKTIHGTYQSFDSMGRMVQITDIDQPENGIRIAYQGDEDCIQTITDTIGRVYCFGYNPKGQLISIACQEQDGRQIQFLTEDGVKVPFVLEYSYDNSGNLIEASYPDGECVRYDYTRTGKLSRIHTIDEKQFVISYDGKRVKQIEQIADVGTQAHRKTLIKLKRVSDGVVQNIDEAGITETSRYNAFGMRIPDEKEPAVLGNKQSADNKASDSSDLTHVVQALLGDFAVLDTGVPEPQLNMNLFSMEQIRSKRMELPEWMTARPASITEKMASMERCEVDQHTGLLLREWDKDGNATKYQYDNAQNLTRISLELSGLNQMAMENRYVYEDDRLQSISRNDTTYQLLYDIWGNRAGAMINGKPFLSYTYQDGNPNLLRVEDYGNGQSVTYRYADDNRLAGISLDGGKSEVFSYVYGEKQGEQFAIVQNGLDGTQTELYEDRILVTDQESGDILYAMKTLGDDSVGLTIGNQTYCLKWNHFENSEDGGMKAQFDFTGEETELNIQTIQDLKERIRSILISGPANESLNTQITYQSDENALVTRYISAYTADENSASSDWEYTYDANGRIRTIVKDGGLAVSFRYDGAGQLIRVDDAAAQATTIYSYDVGGNLTQQREYAYTVAERPEQLHNTLTYGYENAGWKDQLTSYDGKQIVYDEIGNPVQYDGKEYQWTAGRMLKKYTNEAYHITYTYDQNGLRQRKTIMNRDTSAPALEYHYDWNGDLPAGFKVTEYTQSGPVTDTVCYCFGEDGTIYGFLVNGTDAYLYERNALGDIVGIYHGGERVASYTYDAYGRMLSADETEAELSKLNLLYYRGYCMDRETELYYLQSRYYVPEWGRFLNADVYVDTGTGLNGTNLFAYCDNDPVNKIDPDGYWGLDVHEDLTQAYLQDFNSAQAQRVIDGNWALDQYHSAIVAVYNNQKFHFDRRNDLLNPSNEDTRLTQAALHIQSSINVAKLFPNDMNIYYLLGKATHSMQDYSAHGNIGLDNRVAASHATNSDVDNPYCNWINNTDRGRSGVKGCVTEPTNKKGARYNEALEQTAMCLAAWMLGMIYR